MRVAVLTTSYPRDDDDIAGAFVRDAVSAPARAGVETSGRLAGELPRLRPRVRRRHRGEPPRSAAPGRAASGIPRRVRAGRSARREGCRPRPRALASVGLRGGRDRASRTCSRPGGPTSSSPCARRRSSARSCAARAIVVARRTRSPRPSRGLGATDVRVIGSGVELPAALSGPRSRRTSSTSAGWRAEKGVEELAAGDGTASPRVVVGDGPLRARSFPMPSGSCRRRQLGRYYERAAVVVCPSRREGYGVVAREAMAHGRPVVARPSAACWTSWRTSGRACSCARGCRSAAGCDRAAARRRAAARAARRGRPRACGRSASRGRQRRPRRSRSTIEVSPGQSPTRR